MGNRKRRKKKNEKWKKKIKKKKKKKKKKEGKKKKKKKIECVIDKEGNIKMKYGKEKIEFNIIGIYRRMEKKSG